MCYVIQEDYPHTTYVDPFEDTMDDRKENLHTTDTSALFAEIEYDHGIGRNTATEQALRFFSSNRDFADRGSVDRGSVDRSSVDRDGMHRGTMNRDVTNGGSVDRDRMHRGTMNRDVTSGSSPDRGTINRDIASGSSPDRVLASLDIAGRSVVGSATYTPAQPIAQRAPDPIRERFFEMRSLASDRPFARNDSELFYRQAKFMEDFTDDYGGDAKFSMYYPYYQHMGYDQLRTYFTWRTKVRRGEIHPVSVSYAFLYVYELLSGIGVDDPSDGLNKLISIWDGFLKYGPALENYLQKWFKDYHIFYELPHSFSEFVDEHNMQKYYSLTLIFDCDPEKSFDIWNSISTYDVTQSKFYEEGNEQIFKDCLSAVLIRIGEHCRSKGKSLDELFIYKMSNRIAWNPFNQALFYSKRSQPDRQVIMPGKERYYCKNDRWSANLPMYYSNHKDYAGYILKKTEACLRKALKYKYKLTAELKVRSGYYKELAVTGAELDGVIEKAVADHFREMNRTVVTVDHVNLARIREEALGTQVALAVPESEIAAVVGSGAATEATAAAGFAVVTEGAAATEETAATEAAAATEATAAAEETAATEETSLTDTTVAISEAPYEAAIPGINSWDSLRDALTQVELDALALALRNGANLKAFADENGIMLEVMLDSINEKASDYIGDSIMEFDGGIDDWVDIYDEYREEVTKMVE